MLRKPFLDLLCALILLAAGCAGQRPAGGSVPPARTLPATGTNAAPATVASPTEEAAAGLAAAFCPPTLDDGVSPSYKPDMPVRSVVGHGHLLRGTVKSSRGCAPLAGARIEVWPEYAGLGHPDAARATLFTDENGSFTFECGLPEHIHMRISASGHRTIGSNSYHPNGAAEGTIEIVLESVE